MEGETQGAVVEGLPREQMDALMTEMLAGRGEVAGQESTPVNEGTDSLTVMSGGFRFVQGIYWAKPPKLGKQQAILLAIKEAEVEEDVIQATEILCRLATTLLSVRDGAEFRPALPAEIKDDDTGLTIEDIKEIAYSLMNMTSSAGGNA